MLTISGQGVGEKDVTTAFTIDMPGFSGFDLTGEIELHHLVLEDYDKLESRSYEMNKENINSTCSLPSEHLTQVRQTPLSISSPDDATVPRLPSRSLGLSAPTSEHERRCQQGRKMV